MKQPKVNPMLRHQQVEPIVDHEIEEDRLFPFVARQAKPAGVRVWRSDDYEIIRLACGYSRYFIMTRFANEYGDIHYWTVIDAECMNDATLMVKCHATQQGAFERIKHFRKQSQSERSQSKIIHLIQDSDSLSSDPDYPF